MKYLRVANSIDKVWDQLRKELVDANKLIKQVQSGKLPKSELKKLPKYIKEYPLKDSSGNAPKPTDPKYYKITQRPTGEQVNRLRVALNTLKAKADASQMTTYSFGNAPVNLLTQAIDTPEQQAYFKALYVKTKMEGTDRMQDEFQLATREKSGEIKVYDLPTYTLNAVIDPTRKTIDMRKQTTDQANKLEGLREMIVAQAQVKPEPSVKKSRGFEIGG
jgi:hypothetical protein